VLCCIRVCVCKCTCTCILVCAYVRMCVCQSSTVKPWTSQASIGVVLFVCVYECVGICVWRDCAHVFACVYVSLVA